MLIHSDLDVTQKVVRDILTESVDRIVSNPPFGKQLGSFAERLSVVLFLGLFLVSFATLLSGVAPHITAGDAGELALAGRRRLGQRYWRRPIVNCG